MRETTVPTHWYSISADLPFKIPRHHRRNHPHGTSEPVDIRPQLPLSLYRHGAGDDRFIEIPTDVRQAYEQWRPTPLMRAFGLEKALDAPARIYYKNEGTSPTGSHKLNTALAQASSYRDAGITHLTTGTGAGQWGTALAMACQRFGLQCTVFMTACSYHQKPYRKTLIELYGGRVVSSPSGLTEIGRRIQSQEPDSDGGMSIANAEAIELARTSEATRFAVGSGENHVLTHQTVVGEEAVLQMKSTADFPDVVVAAVGAGSNFAGIAFPFYRQARIAARQVRLIAVESASCPKLTRGRYAWDFSDLSYVTPLVKMYTLGHDFKVPAIYSGGLRYHGTSALISAMYEHGLIEAVAYSEEEVFEAARLFTRTEGIVMAPESAHAVCAVVGEAQRAKDEGREPCILFNLSGHGLLDLGAYEAFLGDRLEKRTVSDQEIMKSLARLPAQEDATEPSEERDLETDSHRS